MTISEHARVCRCFLPTRISLRQSEVSTQRWKKKMRFLADLCVMARAARHDVGGGEKQFLHMSIENDACELNNVSLLFWIHSVLWVPGIQLLGCLPFTIVTYI